MTKKKNKKQKNRDLQDTIHKTKYVVIHICSRDIYADFCHCLPILTQSSEIQEGNYIIILAITRPPFVPVPSQECHYIVVLSEEVKYLLVLLTLMEMLTITVSVCNVVF